MLLTYCSSASRHWNKTSTILESTLILPLRTSENTFSISCVRFCILLYPIVPAIPLRECAALNISLIVSLLSGSFSRIIMPSLKFCKCSLDSSINISKYWLTSILRYPHILRYSFCNFIKRNNLINKSCLCNSLRHAIHNTAFFILCNNMDFLFTC